MEEPIRNLDVRDEGVARVLVKALIDAGTVLSNAIWDVRDKVSDEERGKIAHAVATVMGTDMHDMLIKLLETHPALDEHDLLGRKGTLNA
jgi:hypothetical protein